MRLSALKIWVALSFVYVSDKVFFKDFEPEKLVVSCLFFVLGTYWFIVPYLLREDMHVPGYTDVLKKGENDMARGALFATGVFCFLISLSA